MRLQKYMAHCGVAPRIKCEYISGSEGYMLTAKSSINPV